MVRMKGAQRNEEVAENERKTIAKKIDLRMAEEEENWGEKNQHTREMEENDSDVTRLTRTTREERI